MKKLQAYLNTLAPAEQAEFARRCGTTVGYLRKAISKGQKIGESICISVERESARTVRCEDLRADVDWAFLRNTPSGTQCAHIATNGDVPFADLAEGIQQRAIAGVGAGEG